MKKVFKYLAIGLLSIVLFIVGIGVFVSTKTVDNNQIFVPFINQVMPKLTKWEIVEYKNNFAEEVFSASSQEQWNLYLSKFSKLGSIVSIGDPELINFKTVSSINGSSNTSATYLVPITFDTGLAHVQLSMQAKDGEIKIYNIKFLSDILMK
ncbi:hypothetical protein ACOI22_13665 [Glaciecola sp. 2405UD65-10]|uniref:hypothetical protein n=1 Tax=Glaciecola sp. 2405UD65-10 TaxID=3397244 RepID=UPI003B5B61E3